MKFIFAALMSALLTGLWAPAPAGAEPGGSNDQSRPVVSEFVQGVLREHPALAAARANLDAARARARGQARPLYNPEIGIEYENAESRTREFGVSQALDLSGKRGARSRVAMAEVEVATASLDIARKALVADLLAALADYQTSLALFRLGEKRVGLSEDFLALAERRDKAGDLPLTELLTARLALAEARVAVNAAMGELSISGEGLTALAGERRVVWPPLVNEPPATLPPAATIDLAALPELRFARALSESSRGRIRVAQGNRLPDPTVGVRYGEEGRDTLLGLRLSVAVPVRNSFRAEVEAARADVIAAEQTFNVVYRSAKASLEATRARYLVVTAAWNVWSTQGAAPLDQQRQLLQTLWAAGEINAVDYLVQLNQTFTTENAALALRGRLWGAWFEWLDSSGTVDEWMETIR